MTPSARLAPMHALSDALPEESNPRTWPLGAQLNNATRGKTPHAPRRTSLATTGTSCRSIENDKFSFNALRHKLGNDVCLLVA
eukprot:1925123-Pleurochrysis_carterae.AAC.1